MIGPFTSGPAAGADGEATAVRLHAPFLTGLLEALYLKYEGSAPATAVVKVEAVPLSGPTRTLVTVTNANTDGLFAPRAADCKTDGTAAGTYSKIPLVNDRLQITIEGVNADDSVSVYAYWSKR